MNTKGGLPWWRRRLLVCGAVAVLMTPPAGVLAATHPDPSAIPCALGVYQAVAGTPLQISGTIAAPKIPIAVSIQHDNGEIRHASVATLNDGTWRAVMLFGAADAGAWTISVNIDGAECESPLAVTLPAGMEAAPTEPPIPDKYLNEPPDGLHGRTIFETAAKAAIVLVVASWTFLAILALAARVRPLAHRRVRMVARPAVFLAVLGGFVAVGLGVSVFVGIVLYEFQDPGEVVVALLQTGIAGLAIVGSVVGTLAALRINDGLANSASDL